MFGLSESDYSFIANHLKPLLDSGAKIWCFGSRARGDHKLFSDLDLMIEDSVDRAREISTLNEIFEESRLPIKVDIVQEQDFASSYREGYLKDRKSFF
ncbi:MAG: hypothetical protein COW00_11820 [Bdellovibrio sp. CG12_big_fil_rev_8_21_14_0_65_39_13]|nr:MAG: hypothetical protein COW78_11990 [Bdellovibrio sp. CG22_combo_CG10-13_8_21_14_all_39_27]PIQ59193.1 MAG: hypothetical protein COW00_11820 [Bdellovibrio sp. CG12_big_fil_rev_8_21_14_0_65_39_13]PIR32709.1 MAG: hypothetical protein COV37_18915 [Bdellovibrio sp. CG11_big_fil_rev_8_21_14_0_20_39_38]